MPYKDKEKQLIYQKEWRRKRKEKFFSDKKCLDCGTTKNLQLHHRNPKEKEAHNIWSWSEERQLKEISKCDILCKDCHLEITKKYLAKLATGSKRMATLTKQDVLEIRKRIKNKEALKSIAKDFPVGWQAISKIKRKVTWADL